jgi:hypothetical protein
MRMVFAPGGRLSFEGGLEFFNPGRWDLDPMREELVITLPQADDAKVQIFKLSVGDGVKSFVRETKRITYHFDRDTSALNVAGWTYTKAGQTAVPAIAPEPVLK